MTKYLAWMTTFPVAALCGDILWSGIFNSSATGLGQIKLHHGSGIFMAQDPRMNIWDLRKNIKTLRILVMLKDGTSFWNGQTMERSELIPQTSEDLGSGRLFYHFSLMTNTTNAPNPGFEHQIAFFESHFTELKYGLLSGASASEDNTLRWCVSGTTKWSADLEAGNWYNFAYDIDFDSQTVGLWASNGSDPLTSVVAGVSATTSTNSADWHIGELRLDNGGTNAQAEDWYWSGIFVENAPITTAIAGPLAE
ncbi:hypothetical protein N7462_000854 [Penicillium macrosclerotiorum]|uniref:uncharacterized protein n=1 Tax=Penicillium macrosclerotiorum TaxID=303699 RepID=UPI0025472691|nr:uncharacterized protein N7462_000854 [Penicillium macrosclerotiorum]KAJ5698849.1 hypothetical protein N7462_000854 [Penicillium macrosclerotiorum]